MSVVNAGDGPVRPSSFEKARVRSKVSHTFLGSAQIDLPLVTPFLQLARLRLWYGVQRHVSLTFELTV